MEILSNVVSILSNRYQRHSFPLSVCTFEHVAMWIIPVERRKTHRDVICVDDDDDDSSNPRCNRRELNRVAYGDDDDDYCGDDGDDGDDDSSFYVGDGVVVDDDDDDGSATRRPWRSRSISDGVDWLVHCLNVCRASTMPSSPPPLFPPEQRGRLRDVPPPRRCYHRSSRLPCQRHRKSTASPSSLCLNFVHHASPPRRR